MEKPPRSDVLVQTTHPFSYQDYHLPQWHEVMVLVREADYRVFVPGFPLVYMMPQWNSRHEVTVLVQKYILFRTRITTCRNGT